MFKINSNLTLISNWSNAHNLTYGNLKVSLCFHSLRREYTAFVMLPGGPRRGALKFYDSLSLITLVSNVICNLKECCILYLYLYIATYLAVKNTLMSILLLETCVM